MAFGSLQGIIGRAGGNEVIGRGIIDVGVSSYRVRHDMRTISGAISKEAKFWGQAFKLAAVGIGAVVAAGTAVVVGAIAVTEKYNTAMAKVAAMTGVTDQQFMMMNKRLLEMSGTLKQGPEELARGLYFIASAGFRGVEALKLLDQAAKAAAASGADLEVSADALVSIMNAYGLGADKAVYASDILTKTVAYGKVEFQDLAKAIGPVSTISRVAGISLEEMGAALAMLTSRGLSARRATNTLWSTLRALTKPTEQQWKMIRAMGLKDFKPEDVKTDGLIKTLEKFDRAAKAWQKKTKGQKWIDAKIYDPSGKVNIAKSEKQLEKLNRGYFDIMSKMVGQSNAFLVSQILLQKTGETFDFYVTKMKSFDVTTNKAYKTARKLDFTIVFGEMSASIQKSLIVMGTKFMPMINSVVDWLRVEAPKAVKWFSDILTGTLMPAAKKAGEAFGKLLGTIAKIFDSGGGGTKKSPIESTMNVVIGLFVQAFSVIERVSGALTEIFSNAIVQQIARIASGLIAVSLAFSLIRTSSNFFVKRLGGVAKASTFGAVGGGGGSAVSPMTAAAALVEKAAIALSNAAAELVTIGVTSLRLASVELVNVGVASLRIAANDLVVMGAIRLRIAASDLVAMGAVSLRIAANDLITMGAVPLNLAAKELMAAAFQLGKMAKLGLGGKALQGPGGKFIGMPGKTVFPVSSPSTMPGGAGSGGVVPIRTPMPPPPAPPPPPPPASAGLAGKAAGAAMVSSAGQGLVDGTKAAVKGIGGVLSKGMSLVSKVILPLLIVDLVGSMVKEPLGDLISGIKIGSWNFAAAGAAMKQDFWAGIGTIVTTMLGKTNLVSALPDRIKIGKLNISKQMFNYVGVNTAKIETAIAAQARIDNGEFSVLNYKEAADVPNLYADMIKSIDAGAASTDKNKQTYIDQLKQALEDGLITKEEFDAVYTPSANKAQNAQYGSVLRSNVDSKIVPENVNLSALKTLAQKLSNKFITGTLEPAEQRTMQYMLDMVGKSGPTKFSDMDLMGLPKSTLELLARGAEENSDGAITYFQDWATKNAIAIAKDVKLLGANSEQFALVTDPVEKARQALQANLGPLKETWTNFNTWLAENQKEAGFTIATTWLNAYGETIKAGKKTGGMAHPDKLLGAFRKEHPDQAKGWNVVSKTQADQQKFKTAGLKAGDIFTSKKGKLAKADIDAMADWWRTLIEYLPQAMQLTGLDQVQAVAAKTNEAVIAALVGDDKGHLTLDQLKGSIPMEDWIAWMRDDQGLTGGITRVTGTVRSKIRTAIGKILKIDPKKVHLHDQIKLANTPEEKKKIMDALDAFLPVGEKFGGKGGKGWEEFVKVYFGTPIKLEDLIKDLIGTTTPDTWVDKILPNGFVIKVPVSINATGSAGAVEDAFNNLTTKATSAVDAMAIAIKSSPALRDAFTFILEGVTRLIVGESPPPEGPISGDVLPEAGRNIMRVIASGFISAAGDVSSKLADAIDSALGVKSSAYGAAYTAGFNIGARLAAGLQASKGILTIAIGLVAARLLAMLPHKSPAKIGPFSGVAWKAPFDAGVNLVGQMTKGLNSKELTLPGLQAGKGASGGRNFAVGNTSSQSIYVDRMTLANASDEDDVVQRLAFLMPNGR